MYILGAGLHLPQSFSTTSGQVQRNVSVVWQIFFKQQMSSVKLYSCCVFRQWFGYFFFAKYVKCSAILCCSTKTTQTLPRTSWFPVHFWGLLCTVDVTVLDIANFLQIWSTLAGYEEITVGFEPITNVEMNNYWMMLLGRSWYVSSLTLTKTYNR